MVSSPIIMKDEELRSIFFEDVYVQPFIVVLSIVLLNVGLFKKMTSLPCSKEENYIEHQLVDRLYLNKYRKQSISAYKNSL